MRRSSSTWQVVQMQRQRCAFVHRVQQHRKLIGTRQGAVGAKGGRSGRGEGRSEGERRGGEGQRAGEVGGRESK